MSMLSNAISGLNAASVGLNVAGNNVANAAVKGYSRQSMVLSSADGNLNGVKITRVERIVDSFLNDDIWRTQSDLSFYQGYQSYLGYMEEVLGTDSLNLNDSVASIKAALNSSLASPESQAYRQQVLSSADGLVQNMAQLNGALTGQQNKLSRELSNIADNVSSLTGEIAGLNAKISKALAMGEPTAELNDLRELKVGELSAFIGVASIEQPDGTVSISSKNGAPLVIGQRAAGVTVTGVEVTASFNQQEFSLSSQVGSRMGGLLSVNEQVLQPSLQQLDALVSNLADTTNEALVLGFDLNGQPGTPLFVYEAADPMGTLRVNPNISAERLGFIGGQDDGFGGWVPAGGIGDNANVHQVIAALDTAIPGYESLIGDLAIKSRQVQSSIKTADVLNRNAITARESLSGVNLDEEAANLMFYQKLYDANARVVSTADQLFKTLLMMF